MAMSIWAVNHFHSLIVTVRLKAGNTSDTLSMKPDSMRFSSRRVMTGQNVGEAVEEVGRHLVVLLVDVPERFDVGLVKLEDRPHGKYAQSHADQAEQRREVEHGRKGEDELEQGVQVGKAVLEEGLQGTVRFLNPVDGGAGVVVLVPLHGQVQHLVVEFVEEVAAHVEGQFPFHHPGGTVKAPLRHAQPQVAQAVHPGKRHHRCALPLQAVHEPAVQ
jgi:hypothetical protein